MFIFCITVLLDLRVKEYDKYYRHGKVKEIVKRIENVIINNRTIRSETLSSQQNNNINMTDIINDLLKLQIHLRYDLNDIDWPSVIIGKITQTSIESANVDFTD